MTFKDLKKKIMALELPSVSKSNNKVTRVICFHLELRTFDVTL